MWKSTFDDDARADNYRRELTKDAATLRLLVPASVEAGLHRLSPADPDRVWAEISKVDVLFLTEPSEPRVIQRYKDVIPKDNDFAWDAVKGQLQLFAALGMKADLVRRVIAAIDGQHKEQEPADTSVQVVLFAGHRVDTPGRGEARFPTQQEGRAKSLIRAALSALGQDYHLRGLASAAPGSDILFHEVCTERGIPSTLCLPMPAADYARLAFKDLDEWRSRFLALLREKREILELSDREGLPKWLHGAGMNPWERGNSWVLQMALVSGAKKITLIALWDGKAEGDAPGGTAHLVQLARNAGIVDIKRIDAKELLK